MIFTDINLDVVFFMDSDGHEVKLRKVSESHAKILAVNGTARDGHLKEVDPFTEIRLA